MNPVTDRRVPVALVGTGQVGRALLRQIATSVHLRVVAIANSRGQALGFFEFTPDELKQVAVNGDLCGLRGYRSGSDGVQFLPALFSAVSAEVPAVVVDLTAADTGESHRAWLEAGYSVVTANKRPVTGSQAVWDELTSYGPNRYRFECTCGAWLPVVSLLQDLMATGDRIIRIEAAPSGSLGYIMSACDEGETGRGFHLAAAITEAHQKGYTEPDPRDDLSLKDVARKALILARLSGRRLEPADVEVENLLPDELRDLRLEDFLERLKRGQSLRSVAKRIAGLRVKAKSNMGKVLRCLATVDEAGVKVGLREVDILGPFGRLTGTLNTFHITTERCANSRIAVYGPGAGAEVTAAGVLADILRIAVTY